MGPQPDNGFYGAGSTIGLIASELFKANFKLKSTEVKYKIGLDALNDLIAHNLDFVFLGRRQAYRRAITIIAVTTIAPTTPRSRAKLEIFDMCSPR